VLFINTDKMLTHVAAAAPTAPTSTASPATPGIPTFALPSRYLHAVTFTLLPSAVTFTLDKPSAGVIIGTSWAGQSALRPGPGRIREHAID
jgi:hypothetical protein